MDYEAIIILSLNSKVLFINLPITFMKGANKINLSKIASVPKKQVRYVSCCSYATDIECNLSCNIVGVSEIIIYSNVAINNPNLVTIIAVY